MKLLGTSFVTSNKSILDKKVIFVIISIWVSPFSEIFQMFNLKMIIIPEGKIDRRYHHQNRYNLNE